MADQNPRTRIPDSESKIEKIIWDSPTFVPYIIEIPMGKGVKDIKINNMNSDSEMAQTKWTATLKERRQKLKVKNRNKDSARLKVEVKRASKAVKAAKAAMPRD